MMRNFLLVTMFAGAMLVMLPSAGFAVGNDTSGQEMNKQDRRTEDRQDRRQDRMDDRRMNDRRMNDRNDRKDRRMNNGRMDDRRMDNRQGQRRSRHMHDTHGYRNYGQFRRTQVGNRRAKWFKRSAWNNRMRRTHN